jgi:hypothetical protein
MSSEAVYKINNLLKRLCQKLYKDHFFDFNGSLNYAVSVKVFVGNELNNFDEIDLIENILKTNTEISEIEESELSELLENVRDGFEFSGDEGSYPNKKYLSSEDFKIELNEVLKHLESLFSENSGILKFWLKDGHPFYPVYWDYAFLIKKTNKSFVLIGSSSD